MVLQSIQHTEKAGSLNAWAKDRIALDKFPHTGIQIASHKTGSKWGYTLDAAHTNSIYRRAKKLFSLWRLAYLYEKHSDRLAKMR
ncbi:hypothetical protein KDK_25860 [Dictyobacter kobayashii]|uniref:Uncharacterized protein n=1 Tax=Dictyobacter kobayashii TaxID=2014872 RepID=A0A402AI62_9CHLR|nr:hypothetical protein KDK_25860 [Dictyobacter kobayashii]